MVRPGQRAGRGLAGQPLGGTDGAGVSGLKRSIWVTVPSGCYGIVGWLMVLHIPEAVKPRIRDRQDGSGPVVRLREGAAHDVDGGGGPRHVTGGEEGVPDPGR